MIRHILFWKYTDAIKSAHRQQQALQVLRASVATMAGQIDGLLRAEIGPNLAGGEYDLVFYAEFRDEASLRAFQVHPLHMAHRDRCQPLVTGRLCGDLACDD